MSDVLKNIPKVALGGFASLRPYQRPMFMRVDLASKPDRSGVVLVRPMATCGFRGDHHIVIIDEIGEWPVRQGEPAQ